MHVSLAEMSLPKGICIMENHISRSFVTANIIFKITNLYRYMAMPSFLLSYQSNLTVDTNAGVLSFRILFSQATNYCFKIFQP